jgi:hypothetical protein
VVERETGSLEHGGSDPSTAFIAHTGARTTNGRLSRTASANPRSFAVARVGPVKFTGPVRPASMT